jgi:hypothetical protein
VLVFIIFEAKTEWDLITRMEFELQVFCSGERLPVHFSIRLLICFFPYGSRLVSTVNGGHEGAMGVKLAYQIFVKNKR